MEPQVNLECVFDILTKKFKLVRKFILTITSRLRQRELLSELRMVNEQFKLHETQYLFSRADDNAKIFRDIMGSGCANKLDGIFIRSQDFDGNPPDKRRLLASKIDKLNYSVTPETLDYYTCCGKEMVPNKANSEMVCMTCLTPKKLKGVMFEDSQAESQHGGKATHGNYVPGRHGKGWFMIIIGEVEPKINPEDIPKIRRCIARDSKLPHMITMDYMRGILSELRLTKYNQCCAYLVLIFSDKKPLNFTRAERDCVMACYSKIFREITRVTSGDHGIYVPYVLGKIVEHKYRDDPDKLRIKTFIHMQKDITIRKNRKIWERVKHVID